MDDPIEKTPAAPAPASENPTPRDSAAPPADPTPDHSPVKRVDPPPARAVIIAIETKLETRPARRPSAVHSQSPEERRDFFNDAMREALIPFTGILERKIHPLLAALEALPDEVDRMTKVTLPAMARVLDQPLLSGDEPEPEEQRTISLPLAAGIANDAPRYLRPPGAVAPGEFETICSRCGACAEACPADAILLDPDRLIADGLPYIVAADRSCVVCSGLACMPACPTGALKLVDKLHIKMGTARVDHQQCLRDRGEDCRLCVEACPITGENAPAGDAIVIHAESGKVRVRKNICIGCGLCESRCPTEPRAVWVVPDRGRLDPIVA